MGGRRARLIHLPWLLLVVVALIQIGLVRWAGLSPWAGGGFGMFSTLVERHVHVFALWPGFERELAPPPNLEELERRLRALPTESSIRAFARAIGNSLDPAAGPPDSLRVSVWETEFDAGTLAPSSRPLREVETRN